MENRSGRTNLRIEPDLLHALHLAAQSEERSLADIIRRACREYVQRHHDGLTRP